MRLRIASLSPNVRLLVALVAFVGSIAIGIRWIATHHENTPRPALISAMAANEEENAGDRPVFYERVGQAPSGFGHSEHTGKLSYTLEIDLADQRQEAERLIDTLKERGVDAYYTPLARAGRIVYRVRHGIYTSREEAQTAQLALKNQRRVATKVVKLQ